MTKYLLYDGFGIIYVVYFPKVETILFLIDFFICIPDEMLSETSKTLTNSSGNKVYLETIK